MRGVLETMTYIGYGGTIAEAVTAAIAEFDGAHSGGPGDHTANDGGPLADVLGFTTQTVWDPTEQRWYHLISYMWRWR